MPAAAMAGARKEFCLYFSYKPTPSCSGGRPLPEHDDLVRRRRRVRPPLVLLQADVAAVLSWVEPPSDRRPQVRQGPVEVVVQQAGGGFKQRLQHKVPRTEEHRALIGSHRNRPWCASGANLPHHLLVVEGVQHAQNKALDFCQLSSPIDRILQNITQGKDKHPHLRAQTRGINTTRAFIVWGIYLGTKLLTWSIRWMMAGREMKLLMQLSTFIVGSFSTGKQKITISLI